MMVLIPLRSGQDYEESGTLTTINIVSLNPFEIRAGLRALATSLDDVYQGLNPFEIRAGLRVEWARGFWLDLS